MKTNEKIEQLGWKFYVDKDGIVPNTYELEGFINGYTKCKKDMADKKYTEEDVRKAIIYGSSLTPSHANLYASNYINSLNKQD